MKVCSVRTAENSETRFDGWRRLAFMSCLGATACFSESAELSRQQNSEPPGEWVRDAVYEARQRSGISEMSEMGVLAPRRLAEFDLGRAALYPGGDEVSESTGVVVGRCVPLSSSKNSEKSAKRFRVLSLFEAANLQKHLFALGENARHWSGDAQMHTYRLICEPLREEILLQMAFFSASRREWLGGRKTEQNYAGQPRQVGDSKQARIRPDSTSQGKASSRGPGTRACPVAEQVHKNLSQVIGDEVQELGWRKVEELC